MNIYMLLEKKNIYDNIESKGGCIIMCHECEYYSKYYYYYRLATKYLDLFTKLNKFEYRAFVFLIVNPEFMELGISVRDFYEKFNKNEKDNKDKKYNKLEKDIHRGLKLLIEKGIIIRDRNKRGNELYEFNEEIIAYKYYNPKIFSSSKSYIKIYGFRKDIYIYMLENFSELDFKLMFKILKEIGYFSYCENQVTILKSKQEKWAKEFEVSVSSIKKSIMKLKYSGFMVNLPGKNKNKRNGNLKYTKSKFVVKKDFAYKGTESDKYDAHLNMYSKAEYNYLKKSFEFPTKEIIAIFNRLTELDIKSVDALECIKDKLLKKLDEDITNIINSKTDNEGKLERIKSLKLELLSNIRIE